MRRRRNKFRTQLYYRPGATLSQRELHTLVEELRDIASTCFDEIPDYQALTGQRDDLASVVICLARDAHGRALAFSSAVILPVDGVGDVLHLGLTCVHPDARGARLTHRLTSRLVVVYLLKHKPFGRVWCTNVACVLRSLGNVALGFQQVHPSPLRSGRPMTEQRLIAEAVDQRYREQTAINPTAVDSDAFVFRRSVKGTVFQKSAHDTRYHHRIAGLNRYYTSLMSFDEGDEVLQVGYASLWGFFRYALGRRKVSRALLPQSVTQA
jgi:hypothetical protein